MFSVENSRKLLYAASLLPDWKSKLETLFEFIMSPQRIAKIQQFKKEKSEDPHYMKFIILSLSQEIDPPKDWGVFLNQNHTLKMLYQKLREIKGQSHYLDSEWTPKLLCSLYLSLYTGGHTEIDISKYKLLLKARREVEEFKKRNPTADPDQIIGIIRYVKIEESI